MKKLIFTILSLTALTSAMQAQLYTRFSVGAGVPASKEAFASTNFTYSTKPLAGNIPQKIDDELISTTLGGGMQYGLAVGFKLTDNFSLELGAQYFDGATVSANGDVILDYGLPDSLGGAGHVDVTISRKSSQIRVSPAIVVHGNGKIAPYSRFGLLLPVGGKTTTTATRHFTQPVPVQFLLKDDSTTVSVLETKGTPTLGFTGAVGVNVSLSDKLSLFAEVANQALSIKAKETHMVSYTENGNDRLSTRDEYDKTIMYVDQLTAKNNNKEYNAAFDKTKAQEAIPSIVQFGNVGVNVGVKLNF